MAVLSWTNACKKFLLCQPSSACVERGIAAEHNIDVFCSIIHQGLVKGQPSLLPDGAKIAASKC